MQNKTKNDVLTGGVTAHSARRPWPILVTTGVVNLKKKLFERKRSLCCESFLAGTQVQIQNLFVITVGEWSSYCQPREHLEQLCFSAHWTYVNVFWTEELCRILFLPICTSRIYSVHVYIFFLKSTSEMLKTRSSPFVAYASDLEEKNHKST